MSKQGRVTDRVQAEDNIDLSFLDEFTKSPENNNSSVNGEDREVSETVDPPKENSKVHHSGFQQSNNRFNQQQQEPQQQQQDQEQEQQQYQEPQQQQRMRSDAANRCLAMFEKQKVIRLILESWKTNQDSLLHSSKLSSTSDKEEVIKAIIDLWKV